MTDENPEEDEEKKPDVSPNTDRGEDPATESREGERVDSAKVPLSDLREDVSPSGVEGDADGGESGPEGEGASGTGTEEASGSGTEEARDPGAREAGSDRDTPLSELRRGVEDRRSGETDVSRHFHREAVGSVESEAVWAELLMDTEDAVGLLDPTALETEGGRTYQIVPTALCHRCEYFGDPPTLSCTHEGTTIHETVDMAHYRVSSCPMVAEAPQVGDREE